MRTSPSPTKTRELVIQALYQKTISGDSNTKVLKELKQTQKNLTKYEELPNEAKDFISYIEDICEVPVKIISTGPDDQSTIVR